jgi:DNA-binding transcriptional LysR family regulator
MIELRGIETFYWVATLGSFRAAAEKLHTSQPAVSQRIAQLEQGLGTRLLDRDTRGTRLTAKGQALLAHAERMLQTKNDMLMVASAQKAFSGRVCLGVAETIVQTWLPTLIEQVHLAFPDLVLELEVDTTPVLRSHLLSRQIDLAFLLGPLGDPGMENLPLCRYPLAWVASPRLGLGDAPLSLQQLAEWPIITYPTGTKPYEAVRAMLLQHGVREHGGAHDARRHRHQRDRAGLPAPRARRGPAAHPRRRRRRAAGARLHRHLAAGHRQPRGRRDRPAGDPHRGRRGGGRRPR